MKGKKGTVGAPEKAIKYPRSRFTIARLVELNPLVCELTLRNRLKKEIVAGTILQGEKIKQPSGAVGRPKFSFVLKEIAEQTSPKTVRVAKVKSAPSPAPVAAVAEVAENTKVEPVVTVETTESVAEPTPVALP